MAKQFDQKQQVILDSIEQNQLVSAGAGSGKTTVMIQKICDLILSNQLSPSEIVVVTFTNLAGAEMRQRLISSLNEALKNAKSEEEIERLTNAISETEMSAVDTIDGFCAKMCKKYFYKLNLQPQSNIITGMSSEYYINKSLDLAIAQEYTNNRQALIELTDCFEKNARNLDSLKQNLLNAFNFVMAQKDAGEFLANSLNEYQGLNKSAEFINNYLIKNIKKEVVNIYYYIDNLQQYTNYYESVINYCKHLNLLTNENSLIQNLNILKSLPKICYNRIKDKDKYDYNIVKSSIDIIKNIIDETDIDLTDNCNQQFEYFIKLLNQFISSYQSLKQTNNVLDFTDLERNFLALLKDEQVKNEIISQYKYIFVDEYQDINPMQNEIINLLKSSYAKSFFVGDVKQSIYGFRQSTPELFLNLYKTFSSTNNCGAFDMNINFRSNPIILQFNNDIFNSLMTEENSDIDYKNTCQFEPKREDFPLDKSSVEIAIFNAQKEKTTVEDSSIYSVLQEDKTHDIRAIDNECQYLANQILSLVNNEFYDSKLKEYRLMKYSDIAILSRSINDSKVERLVEILRDNNIPINLSNKQTLKTIESLMLVLNILKVIANVGDDVSLVSFLNSALVNITLDDLVKINSIKQKSLVEKLKFYIENYSDEISNKINTAFNLIEEIKLNSISKNCLELIEMLLYKYHLKFHIINSLNGQNEFNAINNFLSTLTEKEINLPIEEFISILETNLKSKTDYTQIDEIDSVTIQTIHASKGLEYPVVILFNADKTFKPNNDRDDINFDSTLGIGMQHFNLTTRTKTESLPRLAIKIKNKIKCYKEELRLLYVATTRAQNKLIISGKINFETIKNQKLKYNNFIELIYSVFANQINFENETYCFKNCLIHMFDQPIEKQTFIATQNKANFSVLQKNLEFRYPYEEVCKISLKNNVTAISKQLNEDYNILPNKLTVSENLNILDKSNVDIGIAYHKALSELDFINPYKFVKNDLDENLIRLAYDVINPIAKNSKKIKQEAQFMMYLPYNKIYTDSKITNKVLVQGVIDFLIEFNDYFILIDFKYSQLPIEKLVTKYSNQLKLYKTAIESAYNKPVKKSFIYRINDGKLGELT